MNESTKKKTRVKFSNKDKIAGAIGVAETPEQFNAQQEEKREFWQDSIEMLKSEKFNDIDAAVERVVELTSDKMGVLESEKETRDFMKEALLANDEILEILRDTLQINNPE